MASVNFPKVDLRAITANATNTIRICRAQKNQPSVLKQVNEALLPYNVEKQYSDVKGEVAYVLTDITNVGALDLPSLKDRISGTEANIITRFLA